MNCKVKYTKELLEEAVKNSLSIAGVLRYLKLREAGGTFCHIKRRIKEYNIDTSHFLGQAHLRGTTSSRKKNYNKILIKRYNGQRQDAFRLRRALIESGMEYKCSICGHDGKDWMGKELRLQVDHINKDWLDDRKENLRFLCPNCHSQTEGYNGSKGKTSILRHCGKPSKHPFDLCPICKINQKRKSSKKCINCTKKLRKENNKRPPKEQLLEDIKNLPYIKIGQKYGVCDNTIRNWIKYYNEAG